MGRGATEKVRNFNERVAKEKLHAKQTEMVSHALRQLFIKYRKEVSMEEARRITRKASKKTGKSLAEEVEALREEMG